MQVVFIGALLGVMAYVFAQFFTKADKDAMRVIRRNQNLNIAADLSDFVNDRGQVKGAANVLSTDASGATILYP